MYSNKTKNNNNNSSNKRNKRFKVQHPPPRPSLPSLHQIFPSPPSQILLPPLISLNPLPLFHELNDLYPYSKTSDEQILEGASIFFFGNSQQLQTPPPSASSSTTYIPRNKRRDFVLFDPRDSSPSNFKGKLVPDLGRH